MSQAPCLDLRILPQEAGVVGAIIPAPPPRPRDGHGAAGEVPWTIQGARGWGGDASSPPLPHFQCCLDLCLDRGSEGALAPALRRLRAMRLIPDLVYFCKTSTFSSPAPHPRRLLMGGASKLKTVFLSSPPSSCKGHLVRGGARGSPPPAPPPHASGRSTSLGSGGTGLWAAPMATWRSRWGPGVWGGVADAHCMYL